MNVLKCLSGSFSLQNRWKVKHGSWIGPFRLAPYGGTELPWPWCVPNRKMHQGWPEWKRLVGLSTPMTKWIGPSRGTHFSSDTYARVVKECLGPQPETVGLWAWWKAHPCKELWLCWVDTGTWPKPIIIVTKGASQLAQNSNNLFLPLLLWCQCLAQKAKKHLIELVLYSRGAYSQLRPHHHSIWCCNFNHVGTRVCSS